MRVRVLLLLYYIGIYLYLGIMKLLNNENVIMSVISGSNLILVLRVLLF